MVKQCSLTEFAKAYPYLYIKIPKDMLLDQHYQVRYEVSHGSISKIEIGYPTDVWTLSLSELH